MSSTSAVATLTYYSKPLPSKAHLHSQLSDNLFPKGYVATGVHCGVKNTTALDLGVILSTSDRPTSAAASLTQHAFKAAPVLVCESVLDKNEGRARGLVVNSGCANAVTGRQGLEDAWAMVKFGDELLTPPPPSSQPATLVMSTGVIGQTLPIGKITSAIEGLKGKALGSGFADWEKAAKAFMTTDTFPKLRARTFKIRDKEYAIAGIDKGAGMIHPVMGPPTPPPSSTSGLHATLLGCVATDAAVSPTSLQAALDYAIDRSFNSISVDGDMSTNDTVVVFANGAAHPEENEIDKDTDWEGYEIFRDELTSFAQELAQLVVWDGEGATKFVTITIEGAATFEDAHKIASKVSTSALLKTALYAEDANWGRVLAALGSIQGISRPLEQPRVNVSFVPDDGSAALPVLVGGEPEEVDEVRAKEILSEAKFEIKIELGLGGESAKYWTCDLSYEYVKINADYRS